MALRVAINGFGRIGRNVLRAIYEDGRTDIEVVAINDLGPVETNAHLLRFDSVHGRFPGSVAPEKDGLAVNGDSIRVLSEKDPAKLPWKDLGVDLVLESTGRFTDRDQASAHLTGGARKVIIWAKRSSSPPINSPNAAAASLADLVIRPSRACSTVM